MAPEYAETIIKEPRNVELYFTGEDRRPTQPAGRVLRRILNNDKGGHYASKSDLCGGFSLKVMPLDTINQKINHTSPISMQ